MSFNKSFQISGIPIHKIVDSSLCPALSVLAEQWQLHNEKPCPFFASRHWSGVRVLIAIFTIALLISLFFSISTRGSATAIAAVAISLVFLLILWRDYSDLDVKSAKRFASLVRELDRVLKMKHVAGLARLPITTSDIEKVGEMLKKSMARITYHLVFCEKRDDLFGAEYWRQGRDQLLGTSAELGFDLGPLELYRQEAEAKYRQENPEPAEREPRLKRQLFD